MASVKKDIFWNRKAMGSALMAAIAWGVVPSFAQDGSNAGGFHVPTLTLDAFRDAPAAADLSNLTLEELMNVEVTIASRRKQRMSEVAAAVSVVTADDISRTHTQSIPEALRLSPGIFVGRVDGSNWAVGSRGGGERYTANLLVMMDGRSEYNPVFAGVYWNTVDYVMSDIDRIEIVRGPGATMWGSNAVNGVINIISKEAKETQGLLIDNYAGTDGYINTVRYGGKINDTTFFRIYAKNRTMESFDYNGGRDAPDAWDQRQTGFRLDSNPNSSDALTFQGDVFENRIGTNNIQRNATVPFVTVNPGPVNTSGGNVLARYTHTFSETSDLTIQSYFDYSSNQGRTDFGAEGSIATMDLDIQHHFALGDRQEIIWGGNYRFMMGDLHDGANWTTTDSRPNLHIGSAFIQDEIAIVPKQLHTIVGTKLEYDSVVGTTEIQPSVRVVWTPNDKQTLWASVSRAARIPALYEMYESSYVDRVGPPNAPMDIVAIGNPGIQSEHLMAYEAGYRVQPLKGLSLDFAAFYNVYDHSHHAAGGAPPFVQSGILTLPFSWQSDQNAQNWGFEIASTWEVTDRLKLIGSYSYLNIKQFGAHDPQKPEDPQNLAKLRMYYDITRDIDFSSEFSWTDELRAPNIPPAFRWDAGLTWRIEKHSELRVGVRNILDNQHPEAKPFARSASPVVEEPRSFYVQLQLKF